MKPTTPRKNFPNAILWAALGALSTCGLAQAAPAPLINPTGSSAAVPSAPLGEGLASLDDHTLAAELSGRGLNTLLDHYFKANHTSDTEQQAIKTFGALRELRNPNAKITPGEKIRRVKDVANGIDTVIKSLKDPLEMMNTAAIVKEFGVDPDINLIEYWGEDPVTQASLKPVADAVIKLLDNAATLARKQADDLATRLRGGNDPNADRWEKLDNMANMAAYSKQMSVYFAAAARGLKDSERKTMATKAITDLAQYDNDQSGIQPRVRVMIGKLNMVAGEYASAKKAFASVSAVQGITPPPNPYEQNDARFFATVCDILARDLPAAKADEATLNKWETGSEPEQLSALKVSAAEIAATSRGNTAADQLLKWRILSLEADLAKAPSEKDKANAAADAVLNQLRESHPELGMRIDQQLVKRGNQVINEKTTLSLLVALETKGLNESYKTAEEKPDPAVMKKGIEAAQAIVKRKGMPGVSAIQVEDAQLAIAQLYNHMDEKVAAANAFLDFAQATYPTNPTKATQAFDMTGYLVMGVMKKMQPNAPAGFADIYARFLPIAINPPYKHTEYAYSYAEQLRGLKNYVEALKYFHMIPTGSPAYSLGKYKEMLTLEAMMDMKQDPAAHKQTVADIIRVAEEVKALSEPPKDDYDRNHGVEATLLLADLDRIELKNPKKALADLEGFEKLVDGINTKGATPQETEARAEQKAAMIRGVLVTRINAYMAMGDSNAAVQQVTKLLENAKGGEGINFVQALLSKLDKDYAAADLVHNVPVMKETAHNAALLTGYLVKYSDPKNGKNAATPYYYAYAVYDGRAQRMAGSLTDDPAERKKLLEAAADRFRALQTPEMHALYIAQPEAKAQIAAGKADATDPDWLVQTGLALTDFDLGDFADAKKLLDPVIAQKKLGAATTTTVDPVSGQTVIKDNDLYWEALYKLIKSDYEVGRNDATARSDSIKMLKNILLFGGIPERWQDEFEGMRKEAIPDFNPDHPVAAKPASASQPATQAAGAGAGK